MDLETGGITKESGTNEGTVGTTTETQATNGGDTNQIRSSSTVGEKETRKEGAEVTIETLSKEELRQLEEFVHEMNKRNIPSFNTIEIKKKYPKAYKALWDFIEEKGAYQGQLDDSTMVGIMAYTSRMITFDFFDSKEIFVSISGDKQGWDYTVTWKDELYADEGKTTRTLTEVTAFLKAFEILENQLK